MQIKNKINKYLNNRGELKIRIDGNWKSNEFGVLFDRLSRFYEYYYECFIFEDLLREETQRKYAEDIHKPSHNFTLNARIFYETVGLEFFKEHQSLHKLRFRNSGKENSPQIYYNYLSNLEVKSIRFSSPGSIDFIGVSGVLGHLKDILFNYLPNKKSREEVRILEQERIKLQIDNLKSMGFS